MDKLSKQTIEFMAVISLNYGVPNNTLLTLATSIKLDIEDAIKQDLQTTKQ
jgi:hypothetical protein